MSDLKGFTFWVRNDATRESARFLGQGATMLDAFKQGHENARQNFRPSSSGQEPTARACLTVTLPTGEIVHRTPEEFESLKPHAP